jgi:hypothetical protein
MGHLENTNCDTHLAFELVLPQETEPTDDYPNCNKLAAHGSFPSCTYNEATAVESTISEPQCQIMCQDVAVDRYGDDAPKPISKFAAGTNMLMIDTIPTIMFNSTNAPHIPPAMATTMLTYCTVAGLAFFLLFTNGGDIRSHWYDYKYHCCGPCNPKTIWPEEHVKVPYKPKFGQHTDSKELVRGTPPTSPLPFGSNSGIDAESHAASLSFQCIVDREADTAMNARLQGTKLSHKDKLILVQKQLVETRKALKHEEGLEGNSPHAKDFPSQALKFGGEAVMEEARKEGNVAAMVQGTDSSLEVVEVY